MAKPDVPYAIRNEVATRLAVSHTGFFLDETLKRMKPSLVKPYMSKKGFDRMLRFLEDHARIKVVPLSNDGVSTRYWLYDISRHEGQPFPGGYLEVVPQVKEEVVKEVRKPKPSSTAPKHAPLAKSVEVRKPIPTVVSTPVCHLGDQKKTIEELTTIGFKRDPRAEPAPRVYRTRPTETVPGPFAGLKDLLNNEGAEDDVLEAVETVEVDVPVVVETLGCGLTTVRVVENPSPAPVAQPAIEEEKEPTMTASATLNFSNMDPAQLADIGQQLLEASKKAEKQQQLGKTIEEVAKLQLEIAASSAKLERLAEEQLEAVERLSKASEALRKLMAR